MQTLNTKEVLVAARMTRAEKAELEALAASRGTNVSGLIRSLLPPKEKQDVQQLPR